MNVYEKYHPQSQFKWSQTSTPFSAEGWQGVYRCKISLRSNKCFSHFTCTAPNHGLLFWEWETRVGLQNRPLVNWPASCFPWNCSFYEDVSDPKKQAKHTEKMQWPATDSRDAETCSARLKANGSLTHSHTHKVHTHVCISCYVSRLEGSRIGNQGLFVQARLSSPSSESANLGPPQNTLPASAESRLCSSCSANQVQTLSKPIQQSALHRHGVS